MQISEILFPELCLLGEQATSRKKALQLIAQALQQHQVELDDFAILKALISREQLGSTAIGNGVALPHGRIAECQQPLAVLLHLEEGVDFDAPDEDPVDLIFCLLVPVDYDFQKLGGLNQIVEIFHDKVLRAQMRNAHNGEALFEIMHLALSQCPNVQQKEQASHETSHS